MFPYYVERDIYHDQEARYVPVPCGKCPACLRRRLASWSHRLEVESLRWEKQFFLTLTYNGDFLPRSSNGFPTLDPIALRNFFKRLRNAGTRFKYYSCGEYGTNNHRPHYHVILLADTRMTEDLIVKCWSDTSVWKEGLYRPLGHVHFGKVEPKSIRYTVQYYDKGDWYPKHKRDDRHPEFSRMSKGIGENFLTPQMVRHIIRHPEQGYIMDFEGRKIAIPRYYKRKIFDLLLGSELAALHPSILQYRDEMIEAKEVHHKEVSKRMKELESLVDEPLTKEESRIMHENRKAVIEQFRRNTKKGRKL